jgi:anti-sigma factor RsiW
MSPADCARFAPLLLARPGELGAPEEQALHGHLAGCDACQARLADGLALDGMVAEALTAQAARVDFAPFVDQVMARVQPGGLRGLLRWVRQHKAVAALGGLAPTLAALGLIVYFSMDRVVDTGPQAGDVELVSEGLAPVVLTTSDGPVVLLGDAGDGS